MRFQIRMEKALLLFLMVMNFMFFMTGLCHGAAEEFTQPIQLFDLPAGARAPGMGGAFTALSDDSSAPLWNPAGLSQVKTKSFTFMQSKQSISQLSDDLKYNFMSVAYPLSLKSTLAVTYLENSIGVLENWQVTDYDCGQIGDPAHPPTCDPATNDADPLTTQTAQTNTDPFDDTVTQIGTFDNKESAIVVSYSQSLNENFSLGANVKFYTHKIGPFQDPVDFTSRVPTFTSFSANANGLGIDFGALYKFSKLPKGIDALSIGLLLQDINATKVKWNTGSTESQATNVRAGLAAKLLQEKLTISLDYDKRTEKKLRAGAEYWLNPMLGFRLGSDDGVFTTGVSLRFATESIKNFQVDYAYKKFDEGKTPFSNASLIAVTVGF